jgi:hypothetical protein
MNRRLEHSNFKKGFREKENACQTNALSPPIAYRQRIMSFTERHTRIQPGEIK